MDRITAQAQQGPPAWWHIERHVLGSIFLDPSVVGAVEDHLELRDWGDQRHALIWAAALTITDGGGSADTMSVAHHLGSTLGNAGGIDYLIGVSGCSAMSLGVEQHAKMVSRHGKARRAQAMLRAALDNTDWEDTDNIGEVLGDLSDRLSSVDKLRRAVQRSTLKEAVKSVMDASQEAYEASRRGETTTVGVSTGSEELDKLVDSYQPRKLYTLGAPSGHGKTAFAVWSATRGAQRSGKRVLYISTEVDGHDLALRIVSNLAGIDGRRIEHGTLNPEEINGLMGAAAQIAPIGDLVEFVFQPGASSSLVAREVRRVARKPGPELGLVVVDYLQQLKPPRRLGNREQEVAEIATDMLEVAQEYAVPVLVLAQLNRDGLKRSDPTPRVSDLRESSAMEFHSAGIFFLYRPALCGQQDASDTDAQIIVAKNRKGPPGTVHMRANMAHGSFEDA